VCRTTEGDVADDVGLVVEEGVAVCIGVALAIDVFEGRRVKMGVVVAFGRGVCDIVSVGAAVAEGVEVVVEIVIGAGVIVGAMVGVRVIVPVEEGVAEAV
jgi:hypothetical protein